MVSIRESSAWPLPVSWLEELEELEEEAGASLEELLGRELEELPAAEELPEAAGRLLEELLALEELPEELPEEDGLLLEDPELGRLVEAELLDEAETSCEPSSEEAPDELPAELEDPEALSLEELSEELEELEEPEETPPSKETVKVLLTTWLPL